MLGIPLDFSSDASYKDGRFSKALSKKYFKFVLSQRDGIVAFKFSFMLLLVEVDPIAEK